MRIFRYGAFTAVCAVLISAIGLQAAPVISGVFNAASWTPPGLPNTGIAQGAIFTVTGTGLGPTVLQQVQSYPLPTTQGLAGTTIQVTVAGVTEACIMIYTSTGQLAAVLPSATPTGSGSLSVTYQGATSSSPIQVLPANFGTFTLNEAGNGPGVITDTSYQPITFVNPAHPGETLLLWGTGLGAVTGNETEPPEQVDLATGVQVFVGNQPATVLYGGRGSSPGLDQINFVIPGGVTTGCKTSVAVLVKGVTGNVTTLAIAPEGQSTCGDTFGALTAANLEKAISSGSLDIGFVELSRIGTEDDAVLAGFGSFPLNSLIRSFGGSIGPSVGSCTAYEPSGVRLVVADPIQPSYLAVGPLTITGPSGTKTVSAISTGQYGATLASQPSIYIDPGAYTVNNGSGGSNVAGFNWNLTLPNYVTPTNIPASIDRSQDLTLTWTGGSAYPIVTIFGYNGLVTSGDTSSFAEFICNAPGSAGQFTIPSVILNLLPPDGFGAFGSPGVNLQIAGYALADSTASGSPGLDSGVFSAFVSSGGIAKIQ
jgi:uncharacterized protein (TIGR03437 family)